MHIIKILSKLYSYIFVTCHIACILFFINNTSYTCLKKNRIIVLIYSQAFVF